ncbi:MAG: hypothetical protein ACXVGH_08030, partial [Mycobacteriales bacterium]
VLLADPDRTFTGAVTAHAVAQAWSEPDRSRLRARDLATEVRSVPRDASLHTALEALVHDDGTGIAVADGAGDLVGWLDHRAVLNGLAGPAPRLTRPEAPTGSRDAGSSAVRLARAEV